MELLVKESGLEIICHGDRARIGEILDLKEEERGGGFEERIKIIRNVREWD